MIEKWKDISGYEGYYQVSTFGRVRAMGHKYQRKGIYILSLHENNGYGYLLADLHKDNKYKSVAVHRLVAQTFIPNPENKPEVNHKNGIKTDNRVENLEWVSRKENHIHCRDNLSPRYCKINSEIASLIRKEKGLSHREIGLKYGLKHTQVGYILQNKRWAI